MRLLLVSVTACLLATAQETEKALRDAGLTKLADVLKEKENLLSALDSQGIFVMMPHPNTCIHNGQGHCVSEDQAAHHTQKEITIVLETPFNDNTTILGENSKISLDNCLNLVHKNAQQSQLAHAHSVFVPSCHGKISSAALPNSEQSKQTLSQVKLPSMYSTNFSPER